MHGRDQHGDAGQQECRANALHDARQERAAQLVGAEGESQDGGPEPRPGGDPRRIAQRQPRAEEAEQDQQRQHGEPERGQAIRAHSAESGQMHAAPHRPSPVPTRGSIAA